jgi:hypothetical protein
MFSAYAMLQWACASVGAILVTINPAYHLDELVCLEVHIDMNFHDTYSARYAP